MFNTCEEEIKSRVIVIVEDIDLRASYGLKYAKTISEDLIVFTTFTNDEDEQNMRLHWSKLKADVPLVLRYSPDGGIITPLLNFLHSSEYGIGADEFVTIIIPRLVVARPWHKLLHNQSSRYMERRLSEYKHIVVEVVPVQLDDNDSVLGVAESS